MFLFADCASVRRCRFPARFHADPENLTTLKEAWLKASTEAQRADIEGEFSRHLEDLYVLGAWKRTSADRMPETVRRFAAEIMVAVGDESPRWMDVGGSDGSSAVPMQRSIQAVAGRPATGLVVDRCFSLQVYTAAFLQEYRTGGGTPVMARIGRIGWRLPGQGKGWGRASYALERLYLLFRRPVSRYMRHRRTIDLVSPAASAEPGLRFREFDCLVKQPDLYDSMHGIRVANLLHTDYFSEEQIAYCLMLMTRYLREGGVLAVVRNVDEGAQIRETGTLWRKKSGRLEEIASIGGGSDVAHLVPDGDTLKAADGGG